MLVVYKTLYNIHIMWYRYTYDKNKNTHETLIKMQMIKNLKPISWLYWDFFSVLEDSDYSSNGCKFDFHTLFETLYREKKCANLI